MFIKTIPLIDLGNCKTYNYYRLCERYRIGDKVRHRTILSLVTLDQRTEKKDFKLLADRVEQYFWGNLIIIAFPSVVERLA